MHQFILLILNYTTMSRGALHLIMGCMYSGKSTEILKIIRRNKILDKKIMAINHTIDNRYGTNKIISHDKSETECIQISALLPIIQFKNDYKIKFHKADIIIIEEAHFFEDLYDFVIQSVDTYNKTVYVVGLNGDFEKKPIGQINKLIPHCDTIQKLDALCTMCKDGTFAIFTKRIIDDENQILVGSRDMYIPVCRKHYN